MSWAVILVSLGLFSHRHQRTSEVEDGAEQLIKLHDFFSAYMLELRSGNSLDWVVAGDKAIAMAAESDVKVALYDATGQAITGGQSVASSLLKRQGVNDTSVQQTVVDGTLFLTRYSQLSPETGSSDAVEPTVFLSTLIPVKRRPGLVGAWFWPLLFLLWLLPAIAWRQILKKILEPISLMSAAFDDIRQGKTDVRVPQLSRRADEWSVNYMKFRGMQESLKQRQDLMQESNQRFEAMLASMAEGVMAIDSTGNVILVNRAARNMLMLPPTNIIGRRFRDLMRIPELLNVIDAAEQTGNFQKAEFKTLHEPRRVIDARLTSLDSAEKSGIAIVYQDVTELRALETMRRDFVANVSHELKTPLASIKAYAETLRLGAINDQEKNLSFVEQIESQAELLHLQIQDLMAIARVESGNVAADLQPIAVNEACSDCVNRLLDLARISEINLKIELTDQCPAVMASREGLETIVNNLVTNAIHYTPANGDVLIKTSQKGADAVIEVVDTGIGIGKSHQDRVFERFYRVDKARSRDVGGTGLGLAIVKHTVQAFGGQVKLESATGKGTKFEIRFPLVIGQ